MAIGLLATITIALLLSATLTIASELLRPKADFEDAKPAGEGDFQVPTATEDRILPIVFGRVRIKGPNVLWWGDMRQVPIKDSVRTGLFSKKRFIKGYRYFVGIQFGLCHGRASGGTELFAVRVGEKAVIPSLARTHNSDIQIDQPNHFGGDEFGFGGIEGEITFHDGRDGQAASEYLETFQGGVGMTPGYGGTCYVSFNGGYIGNSPQIEKWDFEVRHLPDQLSLTGDGHIVNTNDANPAEVLYELFTDNDWGYGISTSDIDIPSFKAVGDTLKTEGNGFSMLLDRAIDSEEFMNLVLEQINGTIFVNRSTGKYQLKLARDDYTVGSLQAIDNTNMLEIKDFSRTMWESTVNQVRVKFTDRQTNPNVPAGVNEYRKTYAIAQDLANQRMQNNEVIPASITFPGVKDKALANSLATRELKFLSFPLAKATVIVNREFSDAQVGDVFRLSDTDLGITDIPMRCIRVDYGDFLGGAITLNLIQDVFTSEAGVFGDPPTPEADPPTQLVGPLQLIDQVVIEAPRAVVDRDDEFPSRTSRIWCGAQRRTAEIDLDITQRNSAGTPAGSFFADGQVSGMVIVGELNAPVNASDVNPGATIVLNNDQSEVALLNFAFGVDAFSVTDIGQNLSGLLLVDNEFMGTTGVQTFDSTTVTIENIYRGLLDSVPADHVAGAKVFLLFSYMGLNDSDFPETNNVDIQLLTSSRDDILTTGEAITAAVVMNKRYRRPYPPHEMTLNAVRMDTTSVSLDSTIVHAGGDDQGIIMAFERKDYRTGDEVESVGDDAENIDATFPAAQSHENRHEGYIIDEDTAVEILVYEKDWFTGTTSQLPRPEALGLANGTFTHTVRNRIKARHTDTAEVLEGLQSLDLDSTIASTLSAKINLGFIPANSPQGPYTVTDDSSDHVFDIGSAIGGDIEYQLNGTGGSWITLIASSATTGTIVAAALTNTDLIFIQHLDNAGSPDYTLMTIKEASTIKGYAILNTEAQYDALVGYWALDEVSTGVAQVDRVAKLGTNVPDLVDNNTSESSAGQTNFGNGVRVQNISGPLQEHLRVVNTNAGDVIPSGSESFTVSFWVKFANTSLDGTIRSLVSVLNSANGGPGFTDWVFRIFTNASDEIAAEVYDSTGAIGGGSLHSTGPTDDGATWHHVALVHNTGSTYNIYLDGIAGTASAAIGGTLNGTTEDFVVGAQDNAGVPVVADSVIDAVIDDIRVYHRALSGGEITTLSGATKPL